MDRPRGNEALRAYAAATGLRIKDLLVMGAANDPFNTGTPGDIRDAVWFAKLHGRQQKRHLRRLHYQADALGVDRPDNVGHYINTDNCWHALLKAAKFARHLWVLDPDHPGAVDPSLIVDERNPNVGINAPSRPDDECERAEAPEIEPPDDSFEVDADVTSSGIRGAWSEPRAWTFGDPPRVSIRPRAPARWVDKVPKIKGYDYRPWSDQPLVEVWAKKSTMSDILDPLCRTLDVNYQPGAGHASITRTVELIRERANGRPVRVLYVSDFDPKGVKMPQAVARTIEYYAADGADIALTPIVLTRQQVEHYRLPRMPIKDTESGRDNFEAVYGVGAVELDALEALHPGELARIVRAEVNGLRDPTLPDRLDETEAQAREAVDEAWRDATGELTDELAEIQDRIDQLLARYRNLGVMMNDRLQADVAEVTDTHEAQSRILNHNVWAEVGQVLARYRRQAEALNDQPGRGVDGHPGRLRNPGRTPCQTAAAGAGIRGQTPFYRGRTSRRRGRGVRSGVAGAAHTGAA